MADQELMLIENLLAVIKSAEDNTDLGPVEIARAVTYVAERACSERAEFERDVEDGRRADAIGDMSDALATLRASVVAQCNCPACQRLRGERGFDA